MSPAAWTESALAVLLGAGFGLGVCLLISLVPRMSAPSLPRRVAPYVRDVLDPRGLGPVASPVAGLEQAWHGVVDRASRTLGGEESVHDRLRRAGWAIDATTFRSRQLIAGAVGLGVGATIVIAVSLLGRFSPPATVVPVLAGVCGVVLVDLRLTAAARKRAKQVEEELPTVLDFLAMTLAAGENILDGLRRVGEVGSGELTGEVRRMVLAVGAGEPLPEALTALAARVKVAPVTRAVDHLVAALDRGAPLAAVLQAQANDAREDAKRMLIEQAGRKEILMLLPLVFLILPLSVLFAIFPGVFLLRLGVG